LLSRCHRIVILSRLLVLFARLKGNDKNFCEVTTQRRNFMMQLLPRQATFSCLLIFPDRHRGCLCSFPNLPLSLQQLTVEVRLRAIRCVRACVDPASVIKTEHSVLPPKGKPEFHAEWLRDKPCDATTTCPRKTGVWCQLLPGDGEHEIRGSLQHSLPKRLTKQFESIHVLPIHKASCVRRPSSIRIAAREF
jgi:hypothetical protein